MECLHSLTFDMILGDSPEQPPFKVRSILSRSVGEGRAFSAGTAHAQRRMGLCHRGP